MALGVSSGSTGGFAVTGGKKGKGKSKAGKKGVVKGKITVVKGGRKK
jgi:hypothetical protein